MTDPRGFSPLLNPLIRPRRGCSLRCRCGRGDHETLSRAGSLPTHSQKNWSRRWNLRSHRQPWQGGSKRVAL